MNILFASPEFFPLYKTGGLGDVAYYLTNAFTQIKNTTFLVVPAYSCILDKIKQQKHLGEFTHPITQEKIEIISSTDFKPVKLILLKNKLFEQKSDAYINENGEEWANNFETFSLFSWGVANLAISPKLLKSEIDIVISNDWQSGLVSTYLHHYNKKLSKKIITAHIIHNIAFPGVFSSHLFHILGLPQSYYDVKGIEYYNKISFQKAALYFSDIIFTVSPNYAKEISSLHKYGMGFEGLLEHRKKDLYGILNGVDYNNWSPNKDENIYKKYRISTIKDKYTNQSLFIQEHKLTFQEGKLLIGLVSRISTQKGIDFLIQYLQSFPLHHKNYNFVILGTGDKKMCEELEAIVKENDNIAFYNTYDEKLSHQIIACCDVFLMPSLFEPCGLTQLYAMKYGSLPLVNPIGGLKDSIIEYTPENKAIATGFYLEELSANGIQKALQNISTIKTKKREWTKIIKNAMNTNFAWAEVAKEYLAIFDKYINKKE